MIKWWSSRRIDWISTRQITYYHEQKSVYLNSMVCPLFMQVLCMYLYIQYTFIVLLSHAYYLDSVFRNRIIKTCLPHWTLTFLSMANFLTDFRYKSDTNRKSKAHIPNTGPRTVQSYVQSYGHSTHININMCNACVRKKHANLIILLKHNIYKRCCDDITRCEWCFYMRNERYAVAFVAIIRLIWS